jgi:hypothetical protein
MTTAQPAYVLSFFMYEEKEYSLILVTIIQLMIIHMIQIHHRLIHLMQVMSRVHLMHHLVHMMDTQHQQLILQV